MLLTTTPILEGKKIIKYLGMVSGEAVFAANALKDIKESFKNGRSQSYGKVFKEAKSCALQEMNREAQELGANAIIAIHLDYETGGSGGNMLIALCTGTAILYED